MDVIVGIIKVGNNETVDTMNVIERLTDEIRKQMKGGRRGGVEVLEATEMEWKRVEINWGRFSRPVR